MAYLNSLPPARAGPEETMSKGTSVGNNDRPEMMRKGVPGGEKHMHRGPDVGMGQMCTDKSSRK